MATFPGVAAFTADDSESQGNHRQDLDDLLARTRQLPGAEAEVEATISSGSITPTTGTITVDTESDASTDNLSNIVTTNLPDGSYLALSPEDSGREVVVLNNAGGAGQISLYNNVPLSLNNVSQVLYLRRRGADWVEMFRGGLEDIHTVGSGGSPSFSNSWTGGAGGDGIRYHKDTSGNVHVEGECDNASLSVASSLIFTLPAGYRPAMDNNSQVVSATVASVAEANSIRVETSGAVTWLRTPESASSPSSAAINFNAMMTFRAGN